jgi:Mn2+/Fe2+ NRAMP family transporter
LSIVDGIEDVLYLQGFLDMRMKNWVRNLITRVIAIAPSLIVSVVSGPSGAGKLIVFSSVSNSISWINYWTTGHHPIPRGRGYRS